MSAYVSKFIGYPRVGKYHKDYEFDLPIKMRSFNRSGTTPLKGAEIVTK